MAKTINEKLLDLAIRHSVLFEQHKTSVIRDTIRIVESAYSDITAKLALELEKIPLGPALIPAKVTRLRRLNKVNAEILRQGYAAASVANSKQMKDLTRTETDLLQMEIEDLVPISMKTPSFSRLNSIVTSQPFQGRLLKDWWKTAGQATQRRIQDSINIGLQNSETVGQIVRRIRGESVFKRGRRDATAIVRTAANHVSSHAREALYEANSDVISKVQYVATLDSRTTPICQSLDGNTYPINEGPRPPQHIQCRSTTIPVLKSWQELGINAKEIDADTRASLNGQVSDKLDYKEWIKTQPVSVQNDALGVRKAQLMRQGKVSIDKFVDRTGRSLTLDELEAKFPGIKKRR